jgi:hypothetical protein
MDGNSFPLRMYLFLVSDDSCVFIGSLAGSKEGQGTKISFSGASWFVDVITLDTQVHPSRTTYVQSTVVFSFDFLNILGIWTKRYTWFRPGTDARKRRPHYPLKQILPLQPDKPIPTAIANGAKPIL